MTSHDPKFHRQLGLEIDMVGLGGDRFRSRSHRSIAAGRGTDTKPGTYLVKKVINPMSEGIEDFVRGVYSGRPGPKAVAARLLRNMDYDVVAFCVSKTILGKLMKRRNDGRASIPLITMSRHIARVVEDEARFAKFSKDAPAMFKKVNQDLRERGATETHRRTVLAYAMSKYDVPWDRWTKTDSIQCGSKLAELFCIHSGLADIGPAHSNGDTSAPRDQYVVALTDRVEEWVDKSLLDGEQLYPEYLPTIIPPKDWDSMSGGGYHSNALRPVPLVRRARPDQLKALSSAHLGSVFGGLNAIQKTPWRVNRRVLDVMQQLIASGSGACGLAPLDDEPMPEKPHDIDTNEEALRTWKWAARDVYVNNLKMRQDRLLQRSLMNTVERFAPEPEIYFPHNLDFRGRAYPVPLNLHPQGPDNVKGLLEFAEGKPLGPDGSSWLAIHGANCFGVDKVSFDDRVAWVDEARFEIFKVAENPIDNPWWTEADKPWCFLAFCFEWYDNAHESDFLSHLPIALDGSCNGLQHFSAMLLDTTGGMATNLLPSDVPRDIYQTVADRVIEKLRDISSTGGAEPEHERWAHEWLHFGIDRKVTKRPVMVLPYGGTPRSCLKYVEEAIMAKLSGGNKDHNLGDELRPAIAFLSSLVWDSIGDVVVAAREAMAWLQKVSRLVSKLNKPLSWTTPSGFVAYQAYADFSKRMIKTKLGGSIIRFADYNETDKINKSKQATSISPNFVHSLDGSAMIMTVDKLSGNGINSFAMIHDSYGTHACHATELSTVLREVFVRMYETDPLTHFRDEIVSANPDIEPDMPPLPSKGNLNLWQIMNSDFFFA